MAHLASFHIFLCSSPMWGNHGKGRCLCPSFTHPWPGFIGKLWCWVMKTDRFVTWLNKFFGVGRGLASFSCTSVLPIPHCLSGYWRGKKADDSCQKLSTSLPCHCPGCWNRKCQTNLQVWGWDRKSGFYQWPRAVGHALPWAVTPLHHDNYPPHHEGKYGKEPLCIARQLHHLGQLTPISSETNNPELHGCLGHSHLLQQLELEFPWQDTQKCQKSLAGHWEDEPRQVEARLSHPKSWHEPVVLHGGLGWTSLLPGRDPWDNQWPSLTSFPIKCFLD